jgi:hypothetical protein
VHSINAQGKRETSEDKVHALKPGQSATVQTSVKHTFLVTNVGGKCLGMYQPTEEPSLAVIK